MGGFERSSLSGVSASPGVHLENRKRPLILELKSQMSASKSGADTGRPACYNWQRPKRELSSPHDESMFDGHVVVEYGPNGARHRRERHAAAHSPSPK